MAQPLMHCSNAVTLSAWCQRYERTNLLTTLVVVEGPFLSRATCFERMATDKLRGAGRPDYLSANPYCTTIRYNLVNIYTYELPNLAARCAEMKNTCFDLLLCQHLILKPKDEC